MTQNSAIAKLMAEADELSKRELNKQEQRRYDFCLASISALKHAPSAASAFERRKLAKAYSDIAHGVSIRALEAGTGVVTHTTLSTGGAFVPVNYFNGEFQHAVATIDPLFDKDVVTYLETDNGGSIALPLTNDTANDAVVITENTQDTEQDISGINQAVTDAYSYRTPKIFTTIEFDQDALADYNLSLLENFFAERIARGVSKDLVTGNGSGKCLGLVPALEALGVQAITATGSNANDGISGNDGSNSIGSDDLAALFFSVPARYRASSKAAWLMNDTTLQAIAGQKDKFGNLVFPEARLSQPLIHGKPVYVSPSMQSIGAANIPVVFGDLSRWLTRYMKGSSYVRNYREIPGAVEYGLTAWSAFARYGGQLLMSNATLPALNYLQMYT